MTKIGKYLNREILIRSLKNNSSIEIMEDLSKSMVMIVCSKKTKETEIDRFLSEVVKLNPLAIFLAEEAVSRIDHLFHLLAIEKTNHVMTYFCENMDEAAEMLLISSWPAEERFDNWSNYIVYLLDTGISKREVIRFFKPYLDK
ncbi:MAG: hypothetical protein CR997_11750 [Acidobacteria bacterium]|nr:MAG: hypothetical protein CR997_11750 [Acidobacteriota bacterium]